MTGTPDERLMARFLLDDLDEAERAIVHDRIAEDAEFFEALCALEDELAVKHCRGELVGADRESFAQACSASPDRQRRLESTRDLLDATRALKGERRAGPFQTLLAWMRTPRSIPNAALVGAALLLLCTVPMALDVAPFSSDSPSSDGRADMGDAARPRVIATIDVSGFGLRRSADGTEGTRAVRIPTDATEVRLDVPLGAVIAPGEELDVELLHLDGGAVRTEGRWRLTTTTTGAALLVTIPAREMPAGDYAMTVRRRAATGPDLAAHAFRVSRE